MEQLDERRCARDGKKKSATRTHTTNNRFLNKLVQNLRSAKIIYIHARRDQLQHCERVKRLVFTAKSGSGVFASVGLT
jgi:hypothetical protein